MIARLRAAWRRHREWPHTDPFTDAELATLKQVPAEGKAVRRHRRKRRGRLLRGAES